MSGQYWYTQNVTNVFDGRSDTYYCSYGTCNSVSSNLSCGQNTGLYVTLKRGPFILNAFRIVRGTFVSRDPLRMTIEGSNQDGMNLTLGSSWTFLYNGTTGLDVIAPLNSPGIQQSLGNNQLSFSSYRFLITEKRGFQTCAEYAELELYGY